MKSNLEENRARLFKVDEPLQTFIWAILINRFQVDYFLLLLPSMLVAPHMIWLILAAGLLAGLQVYGMGKYLDAAGTVSLKKRFAALSENLWVRLMMIAACAVITLKLTIFLRGYAGLVHQYLFPTANTKLFISLIVIGSFLLAKGGLSSTIRFSVIAFIATFFILLLFVHFLFPTNANYYHLLPLLPQEGTDYSWKSLFTLWSLHGGPEYILALTIWAEKKRITPYLLTGHTLTTLEYVFIFTATLLFFGPSYLQTLQFPVIGLIRYVQLPFFERIEMFVISLYMTTHILICSILVLLMYGAVRILFKRMHKPTTMRGLFAVHVVLLIYLFIADTLFLSTELTQTIWEKIHLIVSGITFLIVPFLVMFLLRNRKKVVR